MTGRFLEWQFPVHEAVNNFEKIKDQHFGWVVVAENGTSLIKAVRTMLHQNLYHACPQHCEMKNIEY